MPREHADEFHRRLMAHGAAMWRRKKRAAIKVAKEAGWSIINSKGRVLLGSTANDVDGRQSDRNFAKPRLPKKRLPPEGGGRGDRWLSSSSEALAEVPLAMAQARLALIIEEAGKDEIARKLGWQPRRLDNLLKGEHDLTVREMAMVLDAAGFELGLDMKPKSRGKSYG